jgi:hypothetical protein
LRVDDAIETSLLQVVEPGAIAAAVAADTEASQRRDQIRDALVRDLEAARYAADRAFRQYDAADPANRLVASELETRWNRALARVTEVEGVDRRPCGILHHEQTGFELYSNFNNIRVRSFILNGAPNCHHSESNSEQFIARSMALHGAKRPSDVYEVTSPSVRARSSAPARLRMPILLKICCIYHLTEPSVMPIRCAISRFCKPALAISKISI